MRVFGTPVAVVWKRPVLSGLVVWVVLRTIVQFAPGVPGVPRVSGVSAQASIVVALVAAFATWIDLRRAREVTVLENLGMRRGTPVLLTLLCAIPLEILVRILSSG